MASNYEQRVPFLATGGIARSNPGTESPRSAFISRIRPRKTFAGDNDSGTAIARGRDRRGLTALAARARARSLAAASGSREPLPDRSARRVPRRLGHRRWPPAWPWVVANAVSRLVICSVGGEAQAGVEVLAHTKVEVGPASCVNNADSHGCRQKNKWQRRRYEKTLDDIERGAVGKARDPPAAWVR